jgi:glucose/arabinose dehydrogenase
MRRIPLIAGLAMVCASSFVVASAHAAPSPLPTPRATPPAGFTDSAVASVTTPTTVVGLPDGRVVVLAKSGTVRIIQNGALVATPALTLSVCDGSEMGLLGFAVDPEFARNGFVYIYYTRSTGDCFSGSGRVNRVSRFTMAGNTINPASQLVLVDNISAINGNHNGGDIEVGNDGFLYIAVGDGGCNPRNGGQCAGSNTAGQDNSLLNGKILRVDRSTGNAAPGNPWISTGGVSCRTRGNTAATPATPCNEIYAWGLRNPWRIAFDTNTGGTRFFINDVGQGKREEVNLGQPGANYGWPAREGRCAQSWNGTAAVCPPPTSDTDSATVTYCRPSGTNICVQPISDYSHNTAHLDFAGEYITGGSFVPNGAWPSSYDGGYVFADGSPGRMLFRSAAGSINFNTPFATSAPGVYDLNFVLEPTGWALYYVQGGSTNNVRKITYNTGNPASPGALSYVPLAVATRVFDSRTQAGIAGPLRAGTTRLVDVAPAGSTARAALVNITQIRPKGSGFVSAWAPRSLRPINAVVNTPDDAVVANAAVVPLVAEGRVVVMASTTSDVVVDVLGFFHTGATSVAAGRYLPLSPVQVVDSSQPPSASNTYSLIPSGADTVVRVPIGGAFGVPAGSGSVALGVTAVNGSAAGGHIVAYPAGGGVPPTANVNVVPGDQRSNLVVVPMGANAVDVRMRGGVTSVRVVLYGHITDGAAPSSSSGLFVPVTATREVDSRFSNPFARLAANAVGTDNPAVVPDTAVAVVQNVVASQSGGAGSMTTFDAAVAVPPVSNSVFTATGQTRGVLAFTATTGGSVSYRPTMAADVIVDVVGYFTP